MVAIVVVLAALFQDPLLALFRRVAAVAERAVRPLARIAGEGGRRAAGAVGSALGRSPGGGAGRAWGARGRSGGFGPAARARGDDPSRAEPVGAGTPGVVELGRRSGGATGASGPPSPWPSPRGRGNADGAASDEMGRGTPAESVLERAAGSKARGTDRAAGAGGAIAGAGGAAGAAGVGGAGGAGEGSTAGSGGRVRADGARGAEPPAERAAEPPDWLGAPDSESALELEPTGGTEAPGGPGEHFPPSDEPPGERTVRRSRLYRPASSLHVAEAARRFLGEREGVASVEAMVRELDREFGEGLGVGILEGLRRRGVVALSRDARRSTRMLVTLPAPPEGPPGG